jgi:hypothetical protein
MAPEQDDPLAVVDARTDVFGLGRLGASLLCAHPPVRPGGPAPLRAGVPGPVAAVLRRATAYHSGDRYPDAAAFATALAAAARPRRFGRAARRRAYAAVTAVVLGAAVLFTATATAPVPAGAGPLSVSAPPGWRVTGREWVDLCGPGGDREPGRVMSPDPAAWPTDPTVPGAFVGLSRSRCDVARFVAGRWHEGCEVRPAGPRRIDGTDWTVAWFTSCRTGRPSWVEAGTAGPDGTGMVYVQVTPPPGVGDDFVDDLLAGVDVRWPDY